MTRIGKIAGVVVIMGAVLLVAVPGTRASLAGLFGKSGEKAVPTGRADTWFLPKGPERRDVQDRTAVLARARAFLGDDVLLPPSLDGSQLSLYQQFDPDGSLRLIGMSAPEHGFWVRYSPVNDLMNPRYDASLQVETTEREIRGMPARIVKLTRKESPQKVEAELWVQGGKWVYHFWNPEGDVDALIALAESME